MKIIITFASAGAGHLKAAKTIYDYFKENKPEFDVRLIDALNYSNLRFKYIYIRGYAFLVRHAPWLWSWGFFLTRVKPLRTFVSRIRFLVNCLNTKAFTKFLIQENPDFILSTHFLPSSISAHLKKIERINSVLITVVTDFGVHPFWLANSIDTYIVASDFTKGEMIINGIEENKIKVLGIPVDSKFRVKYTRGPLLKKFSLEKDKFTVLVVTGSFGIGPIEKIVKLLHNDVQLLVICAKNKSLFKKLNNKNYPNVKIFGLVDNIEELMAVSDIIITKPGGLTVSEILTMELAPIFISAIPGQEVQNLKVLQRYGIGLKPKSFKELKALILNFKEQPDKLNKIRQEIIKIKKPFAVKEIYDVVCTGSPGVTC